MALGILLFEPQVDYPTIRPDSIALDKSLAP